MPGVNGNKMATMGVALSDVTVEFDDVREELPVSGVASGNNDAVGVISAEGILSSIKSASQACKPGFPMKTTAAATAVAVVDVSVAAAAAAAAEKSPAAEIGQKPAVQAADEAAEVGSQKQAANASCDPMLTPTKGQGHVSGGSRSATPSSSAKKARTSRGWSTWETKEPPTSNGVMDTPVTSHARKEEGVASRPTPVVDVSSITQQAASARTCTTPQKTGSDVSGKSARKSLTPVTTGAHASDRSDVTSDALKHSKMTSSTHAAVLPLMKELVSKPTGSRTEKSPEKRRRQPETRSRRIGSGRCVTPTDIDVAGVQQFMAAASTCHTPASGMSRQPYSSASFVAQPPRHRDPEEEKEVLLELTFNLSEFPDVVSPHGSPGKSGKGRGGGSSRASLNSQEEFCPDLIIPPDFPVDLYADELQAVCTEEELARYGLNKTGPIGSLKIPAEYRKMFANYPADLDSLSDVSSCCDDVAGLGDDGAWEDGLWMHCGPCCKHSGDLFDSGFLSPVEDVRSDASLTPDTGSADAKTEAPAADVTKQEREPCSTCFTDDDVRQRRERLAK